LREWFSKDTWLTAEQALAVGLVDEIVEQPRLVRPSEAIHPMQLGRRVVENAAVYSYPDAKNQSESK